MIKTIFCYNAEGAWQTNLSGYLVEELTRFVEEGSKTQGFVQKTQICMQLIFKII